MLNILRRQIVHPIKARIRQSKLSEAFAQAFAFNRCRQLGDIALPEPFAAGLNERAVELTLARLLYKPGLEILDVGHANAMLCHLRMMASLPSPRNITGIDIAAPVYNTKPYYQKSVRADITAHPFNEGSFDLIWCISTLEHFGMDNSTYTDAFIVDYGLAHKALISMVHMLRPGGKLLVTVPYGRFEDHGWLINYDAERWRKLMDVVRGKTNLTEMYFKYTFSKGWHITIPEELRYTGYQDQHNFGAAGLAAGIIEKRV
jgi:SAM-dependent methyltransferase